MTAAEKHIRYYRSLDGKEISKRTLAKFHTALKKDIDSGRLASIECIEMEKRIANAVSQMNGTPRIAHCKQVEEKQTHSHEDLTLLYGLPFIEDDKGLQSKSLGVLDGVGDDVYKVITDRILKLIEAGGLLWRKPWNTHVNSPSDLAHNGVTKFAYRGVNYILNFLNEALGGLSILDKNGKEKTVSYQHMDFYTFKQVKTLKGSVKKGETGWPVTYFKWLYKDKSTGALVPKEAAVQDGVLREGYERIPGLFYYTVFNFEQCEGFKSSFKRSAPRTENEKIESAEKIVERYSATAGSPPIKIVGGSDRAFYSITNDNITVPSIKQFKTPQQYYSVLFHEMVHSTGAESRLKRELSGKQGSKPYAFEELIAEMGACFLCGESGILYFTMKNSAAYVADWSRALVKEMKEDPKFFLKACSAAQRAADFILGRVFDSRDEKQPEKPAGKQKERKPVPSKKREAFTPKSRGKKEKKSEQKVKAKSKDRTPIKNIVPDGDKLPIIHVKKTGSEEPARSSTPVTGLGFIASDQAPEKPSDMFTLPGPIGELLGDLQRYKLEIVIAGEPHSSKSELGKQIADAFISAGDDVGWIDWEQGGLRSRDTQEGIRRNVKPENRNKLLVSTEVPKTLDAVKALSKKFKVIVLDSGSSLKQVTNVWIDELREQYPDTVWIILMQQNEKGGTRGGVSAEFDSPIVLKSYRPDESDFQKNYAYVFKNRGNPQTTGKYYLIAGKKIVSTEPGKIVKPDPATKQKEKLLTKEPA